ncbi:hypothetical protein GWK41_08525 [Persephonella atlantica]|uniref:HNH nuclease domain-containing protein n=1 Tax=Persephonella atlantica TaxID=2699429 RepID=A0ABS1GJK7_9AQUI|nr:HNH endonuclease [Persephonella atlantica]MBK3333113.1 hypothetical protein [Persephonella atlantica]
MAKGIFLQPANIKNKMVRDHLERTIFQTVELNEILRFQPNIRSDLERFYVWGVIPGTKSKWDKIQIGDLVVFYSERKFYLLGQIVDKFHNKSLARYLWGEDQHGRTWEYVYLIDPDSLITINVDIEKVIKILNYSPGFVLQSALYHQNEKLLSLFTDRLMEDRTGKHDIITTVRREKISATIEKYKRDPSFSTTVKSNYGNKCAICGIPNEGAVVDAAHIKPVKEGGPDIEENGIALCKVHHNLFDAGLITIKDGKLITSPKMSHQLETHPVISEFKGKRVKLVKTSEKFLKWHQENIFKD